jgi:hypothetical protein
MYTTDSSVRQRTYVGGYSMTLLGRPVNPRGSVVYAEYYQNGKWTLDVAPCRSLGNSGLPLLDYAVLMKYGEYLN